MYLVLLLDSELRISSSPTSSLDTAILALRLSIRINQSEKLGKYKYPIESSREYK